MNRRTLERNVAVAWSKVPLLEDALSWIQSEEYSAFIASLFELEHYYRENWDETICSVSVEVLFPYAIATHSLMHVLLTPRQAHAHQAAREGLGTLDAWMDDVIGLGYAYLNEHD